MAVKVIRWYRSRRNQLLIIVGIVSTITYYYISSQDPTLSTKDLNLTKIKTIEKYIERKLEENLREDRGTGCEMPVLDPFSPDIMQFEKKLNKISCDGRDWVECYLSECRVAKEILDTTNNIQCSYQDILHESDQKYTIGSPVVVYDDKTYTLDKSDFVKVTCSGKPKTKVDNDILLFKTKWVGNVMGMRKSVPRTAVPMGRRDTPDILIFGFDSTSKNQFIRKMPKSYQVLKDLGAVVLNRYNIVGDGTPAALLPILTGKTEIELPEVRKKLSNLTLDSFPFLFNRLKALGYRTAYFEDMPWIGTFQYRFNGFQKQPADHYLRSFFLEEFKGSKWYRNPKNRYCVGAKPSYLFMIDMTKQFLNLDGKKFSFTFVADITHDDSLLGNADEDFALFLNYLKQSKKLENTMLFVMGDHGARFSKLRGTFQGKLEERLPLMAVVLPDRLKNNIPTLKSTLTLNAETLTTPHDIYATLVDVLDMNEHANPYKIKGADLTRGLSLLRPIPSNRSCSEAGIEAHWCACLQWENVTQSDVLYEQASNALLERINDITNEMRDKCAIRNLDHTEWVMKQKANKQVLSFKGAKDEDGYIGKFGEPIKLTKENYQVKIVTQPGGGMYEATMTHLKKENKFIIINRDIQRINAYGTDPSCISATRPHLNSFCYCNNNYRT